jgi:predicted nucleic acid-binding protein
MKRLFLDVNVVLDWLLWRPPFAVNAQALWALAEGGAIEAVIPAHGVTTAFYLAQRGRGARFASQTVASMLEIARVAPVDESVLKRALALQWADFEDAVCAAAAEAAGCDLLVTRDATGFRESPVPVVDPGTALALLDSAGGPGRVQEPRPRYARARKPRPPKRGRPRIHPRVT